MAILKRKGMLLFPRPAALPSPIPDQALGVPRIWEGHVLSRMGINTITT